MAIRSWGEGILGSYNVFWRVLAAAAAAPLSTRNRIGGSAVYAKNASVYAKKPSFSTVYAKKPLCLREKIHSYVNKNHYYANKSPVYAKKTAVYAKRLLTMRKTRLCEMHSAAPHYRYTRMSDRT